MLKIFVLIICCFGACKAAPPAAPPAAPQVYCGELPDQIFGCLNLPRIIGEEFTSKCARTTNSCEKMSCTFRQLGWLVDGKVNKTQVAEYYDRFGAQHAAWTRAVGHAKAACLDQDHDLPAQSADPNCPAFDIMWCALTSFIRNAQPSQWASSEACAYPKQFAASCPLCPANCFAPAVPVGSCNACLSLPRTP